MRVLNYMQVVKKNVGCGFIGTTVKAKVKYLMMHIEMECLNEEKETPQDAASVTLGRKR